MKQPIEHRHHGLPFAGSPLSRRPRMGVAPASIRRRLPCRVEDPDLWFAQSPALLELARTLCVDCPIRVACLAGALARGEPWGVWGGEILESGVVVARKRPPGRPRKEVAE